MNCHGFVKSGEVYGKVSLSVSCLKPDTMSKALLIKIAEPCHERWVDMTPTEKGAFCAACQKQVVDFTRKTHNEIYDLVTQADRPMCGRFSVAHINTPIVKSTVNKSLLNWRALAAATATLLAGERVYSLGDTGKLATTTCTTTSAVNDLAANKTVTDTVATTQQVLTTDTAITIKGTVVMEETGEPVEMAAVLLRSSGIAVYTAANGSFTLTLTRQQLDSTAKVLEFLWLGLNDKQVNLSEHIALLNTQPVGAPNIIDLDTIKLTERHYAVMGLFVTTNRVMDEETPRGSLLDANQGKLDLVNAPFEKPRTKHKIRNAE